MLTEKQQAEFLGLIVEADKAEARVQRAELKLEMAREKIAEFCRVHDPELEGEG